MKTSRAMTVASAAALLACAGAAQAASQNFNLGAINAGDVPGNVADIPLAPVGFNVTRAQFTTDWIAGGGGPWSSEAIWAITDAPLVSASEFYFDPGPSADSLDSTASVTLSWDTYISGYDPLPLTPGAPMNFVAGQTFGGSDATWNNSSLTLSDDSAPLPINIIDLGPVAVENMPFTIDTIGSGFDTELAFFNSAGGLAAENDDIGGGNFQSLLDVPGLPAGDYIINVGGFNTLYGAGGYEAVVDDILGSDGGDLLINVDGQPVYRDPLQQDTNQFFRITVVPTPGAAGVLALAGIAGLRRRR